MTEDEWLKCADPMPMLEFIGGKVSERKLRLFAVACCLERLKSTQPMTSSDISNSLKLWENVQLAEAIADGSVHNPNSALDHHYGFYGIHYGSGSTLEWVCHAVVDPSAWGAAREAVVGLDDVSWDEGPTNFGAICLRDLFANPFCPVNLNPSWLTPTVLALADGIYSERAFDRMPILADALQDAGCDNEDLLNHCRQPGEHCRGCWVVDLLLSKS